jgi:uncharacterized protein YoxC
VELLFTILSVLALWAFLAIVIVALLTIRKVLEGIRRSLEQITMGVRAIEVQTIPLAGRAVNVIAAFNLLAGGVAPLVETATSVERRTAAVVPLLRRAIGGSRA